MKSTKKSLIASGISLAISVALLAGSTFAWFTDSVVNKGNTIQAGNLKVDFKYKDLDDPNAVYAPVPDNSADGGNELFKSANWEPGYSFGYDFEVTNKGSLAFDWTLTFENVKSTDGVPDDNKAAEIADVIDVYVIEDENKNDLTGETPVGTLSELGEIKGGTLVKGAAAEEFSVVLKMQDSAGNEYQNASVEFDIKLYATQAAQEKDGFDNNQYDADLPLTQISEINELKAAIENGGSVMLTDNIDAGSEIGSKINISADTTINGNGKTLSTQDPDTTAYNSRVIDMTGLENVTLTISELAIEGETTAGKIPYLYRGISLYNNVNPTLNITNSSVKAGHYAINIASDNQNAAVNISNSSVSGYCAFQTHSAGIDAVFTSSTLTGVNQWAQGTNDFAAIVVSTTAGDSVLTFNNCTIEANELNSAKESFFSLRADCTVNLNGCNFIKNGEKIPASEIFSNLQVTDDEYKDLYNDYVYIYGGTDINIIIDGETVDLT